jgi:hypothetical protein
MKMSDNRRPFTIQFDPGTIKHLGLQMYSTLAPVIGELVSNAWDADATKIEITIPEAPMTGDAEIVIQDDGAGMTAEEVQNAYLVVGRDRRKDTNDAPTTGGRAVMGRKGIGKFSAFGIASEIEIETVKDGVATRFVLRYCDFEHDAAVRQLEIPPLDATGNVTRGTRIVLRKFTRYLTRRILLDTLRRGLARRFSVIGKKGFDVIINGNPITMDERDLRRLLDVDASGKPYIWEYENMPIDETKINTVSGWIGALKRTAPLEDGIQRGIAILARGKMVQEPFLFDAVVGQQFALSYLVGELYADFVDAAEDTVGTTRNSLVWDAGANAAFKSWGQKEVNRIAREWAEKRSSDQTRELEQSEAYKRFKEETSNLPAGSAIFKIADQLVKKAVLKNPADDVGTNEDIVQFAADMVKFDAFSDMAEAIEKADFSGGDISRVLALFKDWEVLEAKEMARVTKGRIDTIKQFKNLIDTNAREVPTIHQFLKDFPWVLDPRWTLVSNETRFSTMLKDQFPEPANMPEIDRRIDFLCVAEGTSLIVVEIKRPGKVASENELRQIEDYVLFMRDHVSKTTDEDLRRKEVIGYLLVGGLVDTYKVRGKVANLKDSKIYVRLYSDLLSLVEKLHKDFLERYEKLQARNRA